MASCFEEAVGLVAEVTVVAFAPVAAETFAGEAFAVADLFEEVRHSLLGYHF